MEKVIFIDFDGTITKVDTCQAMVETFAKDGWEEINKLWEEKKISTPQCANQTFQLFDANFKDLKDLVEKIQIDDYFKEFLSICREKKISTYILSDGYDFAIKTILEKYNIQISFYANKILDGKPFSIECPYHNKDCGICGTCKSNLMNELAVNNEQTIYIGDGYSDTCPASKADIVFAKDSLYKYCLENEIEATFYNNFKDIIEGGLFEK